ncbi:GCN5 family acetyltransferase [Candidatus Thiothrix sp. Deng01]|uniref:GCN5 family acetyltransferase n=1 Tax=Candidatus Thiothrix phosphatis TaxID=3112415 RepID=A0ABU6D061_9GAMM|nr:hypothetical protein [Candidatus Thiothrix sp. Deng01]MEB4592452.1 GCN5 family acetyltransferase [Candidatus Thiothrix sp. Deng01]
MEHYPKAIDPDMVGEYPASVKLGAGYFYDDVLEYRVWCYPELGSPDEAKGADYFRAFASYEEALAFSRTTRGAGLPLVLVRQWEWIHEPSKGVYLHEKGERLVEWQVRWLTGSRRGEDSIPAFFAARQLA